MEVVECWRFTTPTLQHSITPSLLVSAQPCFRQVEVTLNSAQRVIINHSIVSQADDGLAFDAQRLMLQTLILRCGDFAPAIVGIFSAKLQLLYAFVVFGVQPICRVRRKLPICVCFL